MSSRKLGCIGDVHGKYGPYRNLIKDKIGTIQVGDMGVGFRKWPHGEPQTNPPYDKMVNGKHRFIRGNHDCGDTETECLTKRGWLKHDQIEMNDEVLSLDLQGCAVWSPINEIKQFPYSGEMVRIETSRMSMSVTPNHRVLLNQGAKGFQFRPARDLKTKHVVIPTSGVIENVGIDISDNLLRLLGWIITDGCFDDHNNGVSIYQSKSEGMVEIERLLTVLNLSYHKSTRQREIKSVCGRDLLKQPLPETRYLLHSDSVKLVKHWVTTRHHLPDWVHQLTTQQFEIFLDAIVSGNGVWDGVCPENKNCCVIYGLKTILESIQSIAVCHGWRSRTAIDSRGDDRLCMTKKETVYIDLRKEGTLFTEHYEGVVWCLSVPYGNFMVKRKGCAYFTGNSPSVCKRHTQYIHDGVVEDGIMFCGGAVSIDKEFRIPDFSWWVDEELETAELYKIVDIYHANKPRIMITHECPESIAEAMLQHFNRTKMNFPSRTRQAFEVMRQINPPELWVFGHWHVSFDHVIDGTRYVCLNELEYKEFEID